MKLSAPYKCDYCPNVKGEANHWWLSFSRRNVNKSFVLSRWSQESDSADLEGVEHICSEQCAVKALSKWMATTPQRPTEAI